MPLFLIFVSRFDMFPTIRTDGHFGLGQELDSGYGQRRRFKRLVRIPCRRDDQHGTDALTTNHHNCITTWIDDFKLLKGILQNWDMDADEAGWFGTVRQFASSRAYTSHQVSTTTAAPLLSKQSNPALSNHWLCHDPPRHFRGLNCYR